jgi:hypothetical protein
LGNSAFGYPRIMEIWWLQAFYVLEINV